MTQHPSPDQFAYDLIAEAIRHLEESAGEQPSLEAVAARMGVSPTHFQKMFSQWVGVSPKRYQQYLALGHAKELLAHRFTTLEASLGPLFGGVLADLGDPRTPFWAQTVLSLLLVPVILAVMDPFFIMASMGALLAMTWPWLR